MRCVVAFACSRPVIFAAIALSVAGCSGDTVRFSDNPFASTNARPAGAVTGSVSSKSASAIQTTVLPPPPAVQPIYAAPQMSSPAPLVARTPETRVVSNAPAKPASGKPAAAAPATTHVVAPGETLGKIAQRYHTSLTEIAAANNIAPHTKVKIGDQIAIPAGRAAQASATPQSTSNRLKQASNQKPNGTPSTVSARAIAPTAETPAESKNIAATSALTFRWPVRGRVIAGFGPKPNGQQNSGINFAVPEGTPIRAAEDGVVVYANNELKDFGNLLLVQHANDFVTTYAHVSEILVKRNETVRRGQIIAKSGQTGNVSTPQLHFEIRKRSSPVDPMPYLDRGPAT
jgi:murein DD-endopeptidase MepM/ murein hydrolase activator NlpD